MKGMELYRDEALVFGHLDAVLVTVMRGALTAEGLRRNTESGRALHARNPGGIGSITVVEQGMPLPTSDVRDEAAASMRQADDWIVAHATVMVGEGFWAAAARSVYAGINLVSRGRGKRRVFGDVREGVAWVGDAVRLSETSRGSLRDFIESMRT